MSSDLRFPEKVDGWDSTIGYILYALRQFRPGDVLEMGPRGQMVYPETDSGVPCIQAQLLRDNVVWLRMSDRPIALPNVFDLDADRMQLDVWNYDDLPEDCTAGEFFSDDHGRIAEACVVWFRDRQGVADASTLGCEFHFSPYRDPTLGEEGNTDSVSGIVRRIEGLIADSDLVLHARASLSASSHAVLFRLQPGQDELQFEQVTLGGTAETWPDAEELVAGLNAQLSTIQCVLHDDGSNLTVEATVQLSGTSTEELERMVIRVDSVRDMICGEYEYDTDDEEVQAVIDWREEHGLAGYEDAARADEWDWAK